MVKQQLIKTEQKIYQINTRSKKIIKNNYVASHVLMVQPTAFYLNQETYEDNKFMNHSNQTQKKTTLQAIKEFKNMALNLQKNGIKVTIYKQQNIKQPDSVFPNNWFSTHKNEIIPDGIFITYPMKSPSRQAEVNPKIINEIGKNYKINFQLQPQNGQSLEGTGSLVFDHQYKIIYVSLSERAGLDTLNKYIEFLNKNCLAQNYQLITFNSYDEKSNPIYHTNVMMAILSKHVVVNLKSIHDQKQRKLVQESLSKNRQLIDITYEEMNQMCGNMIQLINNKNELCLIMSIRALNGFKKDNLQILQNNYKILASDISTIETIGGGSARCMVAEIF